MLTKDGNLVGAAEGTADVKVAEWLPHCPLTAQVRMFYQFRKIVRRGDSYVEGDHRVELEQAVTPWETTTIVSSDEVTPTLYALRQGSSELLGRTATTRSMPIVLTDYQAAQDLANWINAKQRWLGKSEQVR